MRHCEPGEMFIDTEPGWYDKLVKLRNVLFQFLLQKKVKPFNGQTCLPHKVVDRGCKALATLHFMATAFIGADGQSSPSPPHLRPNQRIQSTHSELSRFGGH